MSRPIPRKPASQARAAQGRAEWKPPRVRKEPPTIEEAVAAAEGLTTDPKEQAEIAAGLMGVPEEDVRPFIHRPTARSSQIMAGRRTVIVERRVARPSLRRA